MGLHSKAKLREHLRRQGFDFGGGVNGMLERLLGLLGPERFATFKAIGVARAQGQGDIAAEYALFKTPAEIHLYFSHQAEALLRIYDWLFSSLEGSFSEAAQIGEFGCCTGVSLSYFASKHPLSQFIGFDNCENFLSVARQTYAAKNLSFMEWDYLRDPPPQVEALDVAISSLGIDFRTSLDKASWLSLAGNDAAIILKNWAGLIRPGGALLLALRLGNAQEFIEVVRLASQCGLALEHLEHVYADREALPCMRFIKGEAMASSYQMEELAKQWRKSMELPKRKYKKGR